LSTQGTATVDFGSTGKTDAKVTVSGQAAFTAGTNLAEAWINGVASANNTADNHVFEEFHTPVITNQITGSGFDIILRVRRGLAFGIYNLAWVWN
jgi:hypothetical protein